jgi:predicted metal-dependent HD superfamily phosphohydrolase
MTASAQLLQETERHIQTHFATHLAPQYVFHDLDHTIQTVAAARVIGEGFRLSDDDMTLLLLATWFHDTGYTEGPEEHEERSCSYADAFLRDKISAEALEIVKGCIRVTKVPQKPQTLIQQIICDADLSHLGMETYWDRTGKFRQELILARQKVMGEQDWYDFELNFMLNHSYHTAVANELFNKRKAKHIQQLLKQKRRLSPDKAPTMDEIAAQDEDEKKDDINKLLRDSENDIKFARFGRGVETMYRTTYRTHTALSAMADNKANLMLSVSALVISVVVTNLLPKIFVDSTIDWRWGAPTAMLIGTCLIAMTFATLSVRPKVTDGKVTREDIKQRKANLLFFGNFHNMPLGEFQWGVNEMLKDPDFLYGSMSRDLYFLGIVLAKKYRYLSFCYNIFMYGLIASVLAFAICFSI